MRRLLLLVCFVFVCAGLTRAQDVKRRVYETARLEGPAPHVDGRLDDALWKEPDGWMGDFIQQRPVQGGAPSEKTAFKIRYDDRYLYIGIRCFDSQPDRIERQVARRDVFAGDMVGVAFDSYYDRRTAYEFNLTAAGAKVDLIMLGTRIFDTTWDAVWDGATAMEDSAWTAEMRVPLSQLRFADRENQVWGLHLWRLLHRLEEETQFNLIPMDAIGTVYHFGELRGIQGLRPRRRIELLPYAVGRMSTFEPETGNPFADGSRGQTGAGLDAKVGLSSAFTMDLTLNPDFGQVEADPSVMNLTAFETFYQEKRPFFLEGSNIFRYTYEGDEVFYSRRIGSAPHYSVNTGEGEYARVPETTTILSAIKMSGKTQDGLSVGLLESLTSREYATIQTPAGRQRQEVEPLTNYLVGRIEKQWGEGNTVLGGIATAVNRQLTGEHLRFLNREAYTAGMNFRHYWRNRTYFVDASAVTSQVGGGQEAMLRLQRSSAHYFQRPDADYLDVDSSRTQLWGHGASMEIGRGGNGRWRYSGEFSWHSPGLELNDIGYMQRADRLNFDGRMAYVVNEPTRVFRDHEIELELSNDWNWNREVTRRGGAIDLRGQFHNFWSVSLDLNRDQQALDTRRLRGGPAMLVPGFTAFGIDVRSDSRRRLDFDFELNRRFVDAGNGGMTGLEQGTSWRVNQALTLSARVTYEFNRNDLQYVSRTMLAGEPRYLLGELRQKTLSSVFRASFSPRPDLVIQFYGQPFVSAGRYSEFKAITAPRADAYASRFRVMAPRVQGESLAFDETGDGQSDYTIQRPDFTFREFRSNLVFRWEYRPGSNLYLVWSQSRSERDLDGRFRLGSDLSDLTGIYPYNVFAVKLTHYFSVH